MHPRGFHKIRRIPSLGALAEVHRHATITWNPRTSIGVVSARNITFHDARRYVGTTCATSASLLYMANALADALRIVVPFLSCRNG